MASTKAVNGLSPQKRGAITRKRNASKRVNGRYIEGFMSGYLLGFFDCSHGLSRGVKAVEKIAASSAKAE